MDRFRSGAVSAPEIDAIFAALGENGKVTIPLQETF
jgi:uncharacterized glyoxalase superfamily protein PhnB